MFQTTAALLVKDESSCNRFFNSQDSDAKKHFTGDDAIQCEKADQNVTDADYRVYNKDNSFYVYVKNKPNAIDDYSAYKAFKTTVAAYERSKLGLPVATAKNDEQTLFMIRTDGTELAALKDFKISLTFDHLVKTWFLNQLKSMVDNGIYPSNAELDKMYVKTSNEKIYFGKFSDLQTTDKSTVRPFIANVLRQLTIDSVDKLLSIVPRLKNLYTDAAFAAEYLPFDEQYFDTLHQLVGLHAELLVWLTNLYNSVDKAAIEKEITGKSSFIELGEFYAEIKDRITKGVEEEKKELQEEMEIALANIKQKNADANHKRVQELSNAHEEKLKTLENDRKSRMEAFAAEIAKLKQFKEDYIANTLKNVEALKKQDADNRDKKRAEVYKGYDAEMKKIKEEGQAEASKFDYLIDKALYNMFGAQGGNYLNDQDRARAEARRSVINDRGTSYNTNKWL